MSFLVAYFSSPHHPSRAMCVSLRFHVRCVISFPHLFLCSLNKVHRSFAIRHALIHPIFIHRILLFLGLVDFLAGEPVHVVGPLGATFLRQRAAHLRADPSVPRGASSSCVPPLLFLQVLLRLLVLLLLTFLHRLLLDDSDI